jgi:superfamily I DNA/RNA helicase
LAYSIKDKTPIKHLANYVTNNLNIPIYCSTSDQESLDSRVIENKLVFTTIHQSKGRERKAVLFIGFDESYFEYYDKVADQTICPNELYVAVTRASERLTLIHDSKKNYLPFLKHTLLTKYTNFQYKQTKENPKRKIIQSNNNSYTVSDLVSYLPFSVENLCISYLNIKIIKEPESKLGVAAVIKIDNIINGEKVELYESVSDITGVAIPASFEYKRLGKSTLFSKNLVERNIQRIEKGNYEEKTRIAMITKLKKFSKTLKDFHKKHIENIDIHHLSVSDLLKISLYYSSQQNKTDYKLKQITVFDWLTKELLDEGTDRLSNVVKGKNLLFEESVEGNFFGNDIIGEIDCIDLDNKCVYEFKCTKDLTSSHAIQLGIYMCMCMCFYGYDNFKYYLFNIFTNEIREISATKIELQEMIKILIEHKMTGELKKSDEQFLKEFANLKN